MATLAQIAEHSKVAWGISKMLARVAIHAYAAKRIENSYNKRITKLEEERDKKIAAERERQSARAQELLEHLQNNKNVFVKGLKSITYAIGKVGFRKMSPAVEIAPGFTEKEVVDRFKRRHRKLLAVTYKLDKKRIQKALAGGEFKSLTGIRIREGEEFFISLAPRGKNNPDPITIPVMEQ
jgi:hypothetical protein